MSVKEKLAKLRAAKEKREEARADVAAEREAAVLELEERFEAEVGPRGIYFDLVETIEGPVVVKLGEPILHTRFTESKMTPADIHDYVFPCIGYPEKEQYLELAARRPGVPLRCANALATLFGAKSHADASKF